MHNIRWYHCKAQWGWKYRYSCRRLWHGRWGKHIDFEGTRF